LFRQRINRASWSITDSNACKLWRDICSHLAWPKGLLENLLPTQRA